MQFGMTIDRLCRVRGDRPAESPAGLDGFRSDWLRLSAEMEIAAGLVAAPGDLARQVALVLLGEPGMGKTTALEGLGLPFEWIDGARLTDGGIDARLTTPIRVALSRPSIGSPTDPVCVVIDQVDEAPELARLGRHIREAVRGLDTSRLRFVLACRTADLPADLIEAVRQVCGEVAVADLLPLARAEAEALASSIDGHDGAPIDGRALVEAAVEAGAGSLAAAPLTLGLLLRLFLRDGELSGSARELFENGVAVLASDWADHRRSNADLTAPDRLSFAKQIAVRMVLSGRRTIWMGDVGEEGPEDLRRDLAVDPNPNGGTNKHLAEVLDTALFTGRGPHRLAFAHSSFAAYLAAAYLVEANPPVKQVKSIFLVPTGEGRYGIPTPLRETAAWLVTMRRSHAEWLIDADAESLAAHRSALDSPEVRSLIVDVLLRRAEEVELSSTWGFQFRSLEHPGLGDQLLAALDGIAEASVADWPSIAQTRVALRIASQSRLPELVPVLLRIAIEPAWPAHIRALAASQAADLDIEAAAPSLLSTLAALAASPAGPAHDSVEDLRVVLVEALWPTHLPTAAVLPHLLPPRNRYRVSGVDRLRRTFAGQLAEAELAEVLEWAIAQSARKPIVAQDLDFRADEIVDDLEDVVGTIPVDLVNDLVDRAMSASNWLELLPAVAVLCLTRLSRGKAPMPAALVVVDDDGNELPSARRARRSLALELICVTVAEDRFFDAHDVRYGWTAAQVRRMARFGGEVHGYSDRQELLDADDFAWAYELAADASPGDGIIELAAVLFDRTRSSDLDLLWSDPTHPVREYLRHVFDAVPIDSEAAQAAAKRYRRSKEREAKLSAERDQQFTAAQSAELLEQLNDRLDAVLGGEPEQFVEFVHDLQFDPYTGKSEGFSRRPLQDFPGVAVLKRLPDLAAAAKKFLEGSNDDRDRWFGGNRVPWRWIAGELAFEHIASAGQLDGLSPVAWSNWAAVVLEYRGRGVNDKAVADVLVDHLVAAAPDAAAASVEQYLRRRINTGEFAFVLQNFGPDKAAPLAAVLDDTLRELTRAIGAIPSDLPQVPPARKVNWDRRPLAVPRTPQAVENAGRLWLELFVDLHTSRPAECETLAHRLVRGGKRPGADRLVALAGAAALIAQPAEGLALISPLATTQPDVALQIAHRASASAAEVEAGLDDRELARMLRWLEVVVPGSSDRERWGAHFVTPDDEARDWRRRLLGRLADRSTKVALDQLRALAADAPHRLDLAAAVVTARRQLAELEWTPLEPGAVVRLLQDPRLRVVETDDQLAEVVVEGLEDLQGELARVGELLWDRVPHRVVTGTTRDQWLPKREAAIGALLAHHLSLRLQSGVAIDREVLIQPTNPEGAYSRIDIKARALGSQHALRDPVVMLELKGSWHRDLYTAQESQLVAGYLTPSGAQAGIYVVAWFNPDDWSTEVADSRRRAAASRTRGLSAVRRQLEQQALTLSARMGVSLRTVVLSVSLPASVS